jgi:hypothetical protein
MARIEDLLADMTANPKGVRYSDAVKVATHYFGPSRQNGTSHCIFKMKWPGDPRVNLQDDGGKAKPYQVKQLLEAIAKLRSLPPPSDSTP